MVAGNAMQMLATRADQPEIANPAVLGARGGLNRPNLVNDFSQLLRWHGHCPRGDWYSPSNPIDAVCQGCFVPWHRYTQDEQKDHDQWCPKWWWCLVQPSKEIIHVLPESMSMCQEGVTRSHHDARQAPPIPAACTGSKDSMWRIGRAPHWHGNTTGHHQRGQPGSCDGLLTHPEWTESSAVLTFPWEHIASHQKSWARACDWEGLYSLSPYWRSCQRQVVARDLVREPLPVYLWPSWHTSVWAVSRHLEHEQWNQHPIPPGLVTVRFQDGPGRSSMSPDSLEVVPLRAKCPCVLAKQKMPSKVQWPPTERHGAIAAESLHLDHPKM